MTEGSLRRFCQLTLASLIAKCNYPAMFSVVLGKPFSLRLDMNFDMSLSRQVIFGHIFSTLTTTQHIHEGVKRDVLSPENVNTPS